VDDDVGEESVGEERLEGGAGVGAGAGVGDDEDDGAGRVDRSVAESEGGAAIGEFERDVPGGGDRVGDEGEGTVFEGEVGGEEGDASSAGGEHLGIDEGEAERLLEGADAGGCALVAPFGGEGEDADAAAGERGEAVPVEGEAAAFGGGEGDDGADGRGSVCGGGGGGAEDRGDGEVDGEGDHRARVVPVAEPGEGGGGVAFEADPRIREGSGVVLQGAGLDQASAGGERVAVAAEVDGEDVEPGGGGREEPAEERVPVAAIAPFAVEQQGDGPGSIAGAVEEPAGEFDGVLGDEGDPLGGASGQFEPRAVWGEGHGLDDVDLLGTHREFAGPAARAGGEDGESGEEQRCGFHGAILPAGSAGVRRSR
jgi:hypothetical protein